MLARLQQLLTLGAALLAGLWVLLCLQGGRLGWGVIGASLVIGSYSFVLALEFVLLGLVHDDDLAPRANIRHLWRAWWGEVLSAPQVFCWRQPFRSRRWPDVFSPHMRGRRGVLLIHGFVCNRGIWNTWLERLTASGVPFVAVNLEPVFGAIETYATPIEEGLRRLETATGLAPVAVAHSMGGLALRHWWLLPGNEGRVHHAITIATPHQGTWLARFAFTPNARQMRRHSTWLMTLFAREPKSRAQHFTCFYGNCDNIVFPATTATLPGADNRHLPAVAHVHMADHPAPWAELQCRLAEARPECDATSAGSH